GGRDFRLVRHSSAAATSRVSQRTEDREQRTEKRKARHVSNSPGCPLSSVLWLTAVSSAPAPMSAASWRRRSRAARSTGRDTPIRRRGQREQNASPPRLYSSCS